MNAIIAQLESLTDAELQQIQARTAGLLAGIFK